MSVTDAPHTSDVRDLAKNLRVAIGRLSRRLRSEASTGDLTWSQKSVLLHLEQHGAATVSTLARFEGMRPQSMGAIVASLEAAGLLRGEPDPGDGRQTLLSLTPACVAMMQAGRAAREDWLQRVLQSRFSPDERDELARAVRLIARLAE